VVHIHCKSFWITHHIKVINTDSVSEELAAPSLALKWWKKSVRWFIQEWNTVTNSRLRYATIIFMLFWPFTVHNC